MIHQGWWPIHRGFFVSTESDPFQTGCLRASTNLNSTVLAGYLAMDVLALPCSLTRLVAIVIAVAAGLPGA